MPGEINYALNQIDRFLEMNDLDEDDIGILLDIQVDDLRTARVEGNVRSMDLDRRAEFSYDFSFRYEGVDADRIVEKVYPEWVEQLEDRYHDMRIQAATPDPDGY